jgi:cytochrome c
MKRTLTLVLAFSLAACGSPEQEQPQDQPQPDNQAEVQNQAVPANEAAAATPKEAAAEAENAAVTETTNAVAPAAAAAVAKPATFSQCAMCHAIEPGKNGLGPTLFGVAGRAAGTVPGFAYSNAMKNSGIVWDRAKLDVYLKNPQDVVPGTRMAYAGLKDDAKRAELVSYLLTLK